MLDKLAVQVCLVVWKDLVVYRLRRERLLSLIELSAPVVLLALFWLSFAAHPDTHGAAWLDAGLPGPRRDPCDAPYAADRIAFAPADSPYARELMLRAFPALAKNEGLSGFSSKQEILDKASDGSLGSDVAVIFDGMEEASKPNEETPNAPGDLNYTLLFGEALPPEKFMFRCQGPRAIDDAQEELLARTLWPVQCRLNRAHLSLYAETRNINPPPPVLKVRMKRFPLPAMETDVGPCQPLLPWVAVFMFQVGFLPLCLNDLYRIIDDKVNDKREWMMIQGLRNGAYLWGQGVAQFIVASLPCLATVSVLAWPHHSVLFTAFSYSEPTALFTALFLLYAAKLAASCLLFGTVFMSRWMCTRSFTLWWLVTAALGLAFELDTGDTWAWLLCLFLPNLSLTLGLRSVWDAERQGVGLSWGRLDLQGGWLVALMSALSLLMLVTLVWYLDATLPYPDRMRRQPFHFLFQDDFWQLSSKAADRYKAPDGHCCNPAGEPAVTVLDVRKHVGNIQMDHLSIDFICNRITVIFGHSGSGKSTLVKMICGIQAPDEGSIYVHDVNVQHNLSEARSLMSYCAEKSTLYEFMTVKEHIGYSKLLNASSQTPAAWREVDTDDLLYRLRLSDYTDSLISKLAYGVQRKVAVAVALSRPAEVLVLDEPTSGMDAVSQADVWKVLWLMRRTSTIIMTSNKSAEVDVLADRAVILARGVVQLNNEVAYLRENLRLGYRICLQLLPYASSALIRNRLQLLNPEYRVLSEIGLEMMIYLPNTDQARAREIALQLRAQKRALKLSHVGAPYRTIEDAVMRIWNRVHQPSYAASPSSDFDVTALSQHQNRVSNLSTWWSARRRFSALSLKNMLLFRAHVSKFGRDAITCGALFFLLHLFLVGRAPSLGAHAASGSLVKLDARSVGLGAFVRDWPASPVFAGIVLRSLLEESGVKHLLPLQEEPGEFLRSLPVGEWRRQGLGIELHAANAAPGIPGDMSMILLRSNHK
ncbi:phospholipid-transporting ATPase ABCA3-like [Haemaphysalis longicornis]